VSTRTRAVIVVAGLLLHAVLAAEAPSALPEGARVALAFLVLVMLPGYAFVALGAVPPGGAWLAPGWALGLGVAWQGALILGTRALGMPFTVLAWGSLPATALLWGFALWRGRRRADERTAGAPATGAEGPESPRWTRAALAAVLLAAGVGAWHTARLGGPVGMSTDSPDHIGTIRRMLVSGDAFPRDAFFRDAGADGTDPRKGLWHPQVALITALAEVDPLTTWRHLPACLVPLFVLIAAAMGYLLRGPPGAAVAGWAWLLTYGGSLGDEFVREAAYATKLGDQLALATAAAVLADLARRTRATRLTAVGLALGTLAAHVYYSIQFAMVFPALGVGLLIADRGGSARLGRLAVTSLALGLAGLPYLLWRASQSYGPVNVIHTQTQGLLWLADGLPIVSIGVLWDWLGTAWVLFPLAAFWLWGPGRRNPAVLYLLTTPLVVALVIFDPPVVAVLEPRLGYLLMRMIWMVPLAALLAWMLPGLTRAVRHGPSRLLPALALAGVLAVLAPALVDSARVLVDPAGQVAWERRYGAGLWADALDWMKTRLAPGTVVLSDPATSYSVPMHTGLFVVTLSDQHSSPNDSRALQRILDARDALDPYASWDRVRELIRRHRVDVIALNDRYLEPPQLDYWTPRPVWFAGARARFDRHPAAFEPIFDTPRFVVYRVHAAALDTIAAAVPPRPFVAQWEPGAWPPGRVLDPALPELCGFRLSRREAAPGDTIRGVADWRATTPRSPGSYVVAVRFDTPLPGGWRPPKVVGKPVRKLIERVRGERYRFREDHLPVGGAYGVDLWRPDQVVRDSFTFTVPRDVAAGHYRVGVRMLVQPHYPNHRLSDYFQDDDYFSGLEVGSFVVTRSSL